MLSASKKKLFFAHRKIFQPVDPFQHQDVFLKGQLGEFCQLQPFQVEIYLFFLPKFKINATNAAFRLGARARCPRTILDG